jgi:hypothetical protein
MLLRVDRKGSLLSPAIEGITAAAAVCTLQAAGQEMALLALNNRLSTQRMNTA